MIKAPSIIQAAKKRIMAKDPSQRSIGLLTYNNEVYNGELFLEIIRPFTELVKNKVKNLIAGEKILQNLFSGDELDIGEVFIKKELNEENLAFSKENESKMLAFSNLSEIKKNPNFEKFKTAFSKVNDYYKTSNTNFYHKAYYIRYADISPEERLICTNISDEIIENVLSIKTPRNSKNNGTKLTLYELALTDMLFQLYENNFNL